MFLISKPDNHCASERSRELCSNVGQHIVPVKIRKRGDGKRHSGIQVAATTEMGRRKYTYKHSHRPTECDDNPTAIMPLGFVEHNIGDDSVAKNNKQGSSNKFSEKG